LLAALKAEREKRQQLEQRLAEVSKPTDGKSDDFYADPEKSVDERVNKLVAPIRERFFNQSLKAAAKEHEDFEAAAAHFATLLESDPSLHGLWMASEDPGEFVYQRGSDTPAHREAQVAKVKEQLSAKDAEIAALKARLEAAETAKKASDEVPESLNRQPSGAVPERDSDRMGLDRSRKA
jgi:hypothetical protein